MADLIRPLPALAGEYDSRPFQGNKVIERKDALFNPSFLTLPAVGRVYWDLLAFLNGYASTPGMDLGSLIDAQWQGVPANNGAITVGIDDTNRFWISSSQDRIEIKANANNAFFGFDVSGQASGFVAPFKVTAVNPFKRGIFELPGTIEIKNLTAGGSMFTPSDRPRVQCLPTWCRVRGSENDLDDVWSTHTLEDLDVAAHKAVWSVDTKGHVTCSYFEDGGFAFLNAGVGASGIPFARSLGAQTSIGTAPGVPADTVTNGQGGRKTWTSARPAPSFLAAARGMVEIRREVRGRDESAIMTDGSVVSSGLPPIKGWRCTIRALGPALGYAADQERHLRDWWAHARRQITIYPQWGDVSNTNGSIDVRRHVDPKQAETIFFSDGITAEGELEETHFGKRRGGRLLCRRHPRDNQSRIESYEGETDVFQDVKIRLLDDPSR